MTARLPETGVSMPSRASTSLLRATVLCQSSWGYTCQCPLGLVPHCYVRSAVVHSVNKDGVSMPSRASTSLLLFRSVKDLRVINSYVSMPSRASTSLLPAILGNIGRMTSLCQCPLGLVPHCYDSKIANFENDSIELCQCPLGLVPHCYGSNIFPYGSASACVNALSG